jgi:hypothetical protein
VASLLMALHVSEPAQILGRYSTSFTVVLVAMFGVTGLAGVLSVLSRSGRLPTIRLPGGWWFGWSVIIVGLVALIFVWLFLQSASGHIPAIGLFRIYVVGLIIAGMFGALHISGIGAWQIGSRWRLFLLLLITILAVGFIARYLGKIPAPRFFDEPWLVNWGWSIAKTGTFHSYMYPMYPARTIALAPVLLPISGYWMNIFGLGLDQLRLYYLLFGLLAIPLIYLTTRHLYGSIAALISVGVAAFVPLLHNYARTDLLIPTLVTAALYLFFTARETGSLWRHFVAGVCLGFAMEGHPYAARFAVAFGLIYVVEYVRMLLRERRWRWNPAFCCFVAGGLTYIPFYVVAHLLIVPGSTLDLTRVIGEYGNQSSLGGADPLFVRGIKVSLAWYQEYMAQHPLELALGAAGIAAALLRRTYADRVWVTIILVSSLIFVVIMAHMAPYYYIHNLPFIAILGGAMFAQVARVERTSAQSVSAGTRHSSSALTFVGLAGVGTVVALFSAQTVLVGARSGNIDDFIQVGRKVDLLIPPNVTVVGWEAYYLGMPHREGFVASTSFLDAPPDKWGVSPPTAIILTRGLDNTFRNVDSYIQQADLVRAYCFPMYHFGGEAILFLPRANLPADAPVNCAPASADSTGTTK